MNKNILLACRDAVIGYDNTVAVNGVSFELERGDYLCIVGENGSGKSTLLKGILGLIPMRGGSVDFADGLKRTDIGYLPQQTQAQRDFPATVREVVLSGCLNGSKGPFYSRTDRSLVNKNMEKLSITNIANRSYRELSGGQQQRVLLARALCAAKELLLLDEPVTGLDPVVTAEFYRLIDTGIFDVVQVQYNVLFQHPYDPFFQSGSMYYCEEKGMGIVTMRSLTSGIFQKWMRIIQPDNTFDYSKALIQYVLSNPLVDTALLGMRSVAQVEENVAVCLDTAHRIDLAELHKRKVD